MRVPVKQPKPKARPHGADKARAAALEKVRARKREARYHGVHYDKKRRRWNLSVKVDGKRQLVGTFGTAVAAAEAREQLICHYGPGSGERNFPRRRFDPRTLEGLKRELKAAKDKPSSRYHGVCRVAGSNSWRGYLSHAGRLISAGTWTTERAAAQARDRAALYYLGNSAKLNFPKVAHKIKPASAAVLAEECWQQRKRRTHSRFFGVTRGEGGRWHAQTTTLPQKKLGTFETEIEAARAMDRYTKEQRLPNPRWNFDPVTGKALYGERKVADGAPARRKHRARTAAK